MFLAEAACLRKSGAAFHLAHFRFATAVLVTPSPYMGGCCAPFPRADWFGTMLAAETTTANTIIAPVNRAGAGCAMLLAKSLSLCIAAAACSRAGHFG